MFISGLNPIFYPQSLDSFKFIRVITDQDKPFATCMAGDMQIIHTDCHSQLFKVCPNCAIMSSRFHTVFKNLQT